MKNSGTCAHTHTCSNLPGPATSTHAHTCYHTHTQVHHSGEGDRGGKEPLKPDWKPAGNKEAVRKYREKKKAHAVYLEEEVTKLRNLNQQLLRRLQGHATLEAEVLSLRSLLVGIRAKIEAELGI